MAPARSRARAARRAASASDAVTVLAERGSGGGGGERRGAPVSTALRVRHTRADTGGRGCVRQDGRPRARARALGRCSDMQRAAPRGARLLHTSSATSLTAQLPAAAACAVRRRSVSCAAPRRRKVVLCTRRTEGAASHKALLGRCRSVEEQATQGAAARCGAAPGVWPRNAGAEADRSVRRGAAAPAPQPRGGQSETWAAHVAARRKSRKGRPCGAVPRLAGRRTT